MHQHAVTAAVRAGPGPRFLLSAASEEQFPEDVGAEVAFAGRSNSGKSSAINALTGRNALVRVSRTPGRIKHGGPRIGEHSRDVLQDMVRSGKIDAALGERVMAWAKQKTKG